LHLHTHLPRYSSRDDVVKAARTAGLWVQAFWRNSDPESLDFFCSDVLENLMLEGFPALDATLEKYNLEVASDHRELL
jgi:hypothetical protein